MNRDGDGAEGSDRGDPAQPDLWSDTRGAYQTEYTVVLVLVALLGAIAIASLSSPLIDYHESILTMIVSPVP